MVEEVQEVPPLRGLGQAPDSTLGAWPLRFMLPSALRQGVAGTQEGRARGGQGKMKTKKKGIPFIPGWKVVRTKVKCPEKDRKILESKRWVRKEIQHVVNPKLLDVESEKR